MLKFYFFKLNFTLKVKVNSPIKQLGSIYTFDPNLVILAWMGDKLVIDVQTDTHKEQTTKLASGKTA